MLKLLNGLNEFKVTNIKVITVTNLIDILNLTFLSSVCIDRYIYFSSLNEEARLNGHSYYPLSQDKTSS
uniref:Uncharacterized protein n=1 Tax=Phlebotomus papatasi TaxID=29031 RepID=A0A1B0D8G5_PHLPP